MAAIFESSSKLGDPQEVDHSTLSSSATTPINYGKYDLKINFENQTISGIVEYRVAITPSTATTEFVLDTNHLDIASVTCYTKSNTPAWSSSIDPGTACQWSLDAKSGDLGNALRVELPALSQTDFDAGKSIWCKIVYSTTAQSGALQWLPPEQTAGKQHPFCFTQCQAIHARSLLPCQDTPRIKVPYSARVRVAEPFTVLMSAAGNFAQKPSMLPGLGPNDKPERGFIFEQQQPIPSYLIAIACGDLAFLPTSDYTGVWAEPSVVEAAAFEFSETEPMVAAGSIITGCDYKETWGRYGKYFFGECYTSTIIWYICLYLFITYYFFLTIFLFLLFSSRFSFFSPKRCIMYASFFSLWWYGKSMFNICNTHVTSR